MVTILALFLGDSVLGLAITTHLFPRLETYGAGRLTKIRAQAVSGRSCRAVAERLGIPGRLRAALAADMQRCTPPTTRSRRRCTQPAKQPGSGSGKCR